jgi:hypothetical protein
MKLIEAVKNKKKGVIRKFEHFLPIYDSFFEGVREENLNLLEIGVGWGGSLYTWREYLPKARITGIDNNPKRKEFEGENIKVFIGDQADSQFLKSVNRERGPFDIIIDDGSHMMHQQIKSFNTLFPRLKDGGVYVIEDWHTSYMPKYQDGGQRTVDRLKELIDGLNFWITPDKSPDYFAENIVSLHFESGIVFIRKGKNVKPTMLCQ